MSYRWQKSLKSWLVVNMSIIAPIFVCDSLTTTSTQKTCFQNISEKNASSTTWCCLQNKIINHTLVCYPMGRGWKLLYIGYQPNLLLVQESNTWKFISRIHSEMQITCKWIIKYYALSKCNYNLQYYTYILFVHH